MIETSKAKSLKAKINNYAKLHKLSAQVVLQNYMFERFLQRLSISDLKDKFIIKGGMLIANLVGLDCRSTMDLDATLKKLPFTEKEVEDVLKSIFEIPLDDDVSFKFVSILPIRKDDKYGGFRVRFDAIFDSIETPLSLDVSTGDVITPNPVEYEISGIFDDKISINLLGYNIETVLAEKAETILTRGILTTRPRDFYDVYILCETKTFSNQIFIEALKATAEHRGTLGKISSRSAIISTISEIEENEGLRTQWQKYQKKFSYAKEISFEKTILALKSLFQ